MNTQKLTPWHKIILVSADHNGLTSEWCAGYAEQLVFGERLPFASGAVQRAVQRAETATHTAALTEFYVSDTMAHWEPSIPSEVDQGDALTRDDIDWTGFRPDAPCTWLGEAWLGNENLGIIVLRTDSDAEAREWMDAQVRVVDGHRTAYCTDGVQWSVRVDGPGGAEATTCEADVPLAIRDAYQASADAEMAFRDGTYGADSEQA